MPRPSLRARTAQKLAAANERNSSVNLSAREKRLLPKLAFKPRSGFTPELLDRQINSLNKVDNVSVPGWGAVNIGRERRDSVVATGADYADFVQQTRRDLTTLSSTETGREIAGRLQASGKNVRIVNRGIEDSRSGGSARPLGKSAFADVPGTGADTRVTHQPDRTVLEPRTDDPNWVGQSTSVSLGHELIHAVHNAEGTNMTPPKIPKGMLDPEERRTVGSPIPEGSQQQRELTENQLRKDLDLPQRTHYGKYKV